MNESITNQERGKRIDNRLHGLRMSVRAFSDESGVSRDTMRSAIQGAESVRASTYREIESWLDKLEDTRDIDAEPVTENAERGAAIAERLTDLRMSVRAFCAETGIDRKTLSRAIEGAGNVRSRTYREIENWLDRFEARGVEEEPRIEVTLSIRAGDLRRVLDMLDLRQE